MKIQRNSFIVFFSVLLVFVLAGYLFLIQPARPETASDSQTKCANSNDQLRCWEAMIKQTVKQQGLSAGFDRLALLYDTEPEFEGQCHAYTHELGNEAYQMFSARESISLSSKTSYCGYGFYHGFMEALLQSGQTVAQAQEFCAYADKQLAEYNKKTSIACYHGIGHGAVDGTDLGAWGNPQALINPALQICLAVSRSPEQNYQCGTGVFNSLAIALNAGSYNLKQPRDPYAICYAQTANFKKACFEQMNSEAMAIGQGDFDKAMGFALKINNPDDAIIAVENLGPSAVAAKFGQPQRDYTKEITTCQRLSPSLRAVCIDGLVGGILEFGKPDYEYVEATSFCKYQILSNPDRDNCYKRMISSFGVLYPRSKSKEICAGIDAEYQKYCKPYE